MDCGMVRLIHLLVGLNEKGVHDEVLSRTVGLPEERFSVFKGPRALL